jgi:hypothetical protein
MMMTDHPYGTQRVPGISEYQSVDALRAAMILGEFERA